MTATVLSEDVEAMAAWLEDDDGTPVLCMDTNHGQTIAIELSPGAFSGIIDGIQNGPMNKRGETEP